MSELSEKNKYEIADDKNKKVVRFKDLKIGEYFIFYGWSDVRLKIGDNANLDTFDGCICFMENEDYYDEKVHPLRADIRLDYIYEGKE